MQKLFISFIISSFITSFAFSQVRILQDYIEKGHNYEQICRKAEKMIRKNKLEDAEYREKEFRGKGKKKDFLDDDKLKYERWKWYWRDRQTEDGNFPDLQRQWTLYKDVLKHAGVQNRNPDSNWKHEGPVRNSGGYWGMGRTTHISFHPTQANIFYVASPNGGLWKTIDNGITYESIADNLPYQPVGIVIVDPVAPNTLYITLGEKEGWWQYSMGVYKTTDGGKNWNPTGLNWKLTDNKVIYALEMNPLNSSILIAATSDGLYKTWNGGNSWNKIRNENFSDVKFKPGDTTVVYAASNDYWGESNVFRSTDGGNNFVKSSDFALQKVFLRFATTNADPEYLGINMSVDGARKFHLSKNSGQNFEYISDMPENLVMYFSQQNKNIMYCGYVVIYKSFDGGRNWTQITNWWNDGNYPEVHADHHFIGHHPDKQHELYFGCDGGVYRYDENANRWDELVNGLAITQFYKLAISTTNPPVIIGGSQDNGGWIKRSNGSWGNTNGGDAMSQVIDPTNANIGYTEYWGGNAVYRTTNGFNDLTDITANIGADLPGQWVTPFSLNPQNPKTFIIGYNEIFVSHDRCNSFKKISNNLTGHIDNDLRDVKINPADTNMIVACRANLIYVSNDFGKNWKSTSLVTSLEVTGIEFHPKDPSRLWCTRAGYGAVKVMYSKDRGNTWTNITKNFVNTVVSCIIYDEASNMLFAGTDFGVFYSDADVVDWQYYGIGLPHTAVTDLKIHKTLRKLYISTYGRGFYSIPLPDCDPVDLQISASVNGNSFIISDTITICIGSTIQLKVQDTLVGLYRWRGPQLDTSSNNLYEWNAGSFNNINKTGNYIIEYHSPKSCIKLDTLYIKVYGRPAFKLLMDNPQLDCNNKLIVLKPSLTNDPQNYSYKWFLPNGDEVSNYDISTAIPGKYYFELINRNTNCSFSDSIELIKYDDPSIDLVSLTHNLCHGDSIGTIKVNIIAGRAPFQLDWNGPHFGNELNELKAGVYHLQIKDSNNCIVSDSFEIKEPTDFLVDYKITGATAMNGSILLDVSGATPPYIFEWQSNGLVISNDEDLMNASSGIYDLTIKDANDCLFKLNGLEISEIVSNEDIIKNSFSIYPNPAKQILTLTAKDQMVITELHGINLQGKIINLNIRRNSNNIFEMNIVNLKPGEYFLRWKANGKWFEKSFTKI